MINASAFGLLLAAAAAVPLFASDLTLTVLTFATIAAVSALGFNITFGMTGQLSMFHAAAFGLGGYGTLIAMRDFGLAFLPALAVAGLLVAVLAVLTGFVCFRFRLKEFYFAVTTMALSEIVRLIVLNWHDVTNGSLGLTITEKPTLALPGLPELVLDGQAPWYYAGLVAVLAAMLVCRQVQRSWIGRAFAAVRLNDELSDTLAIDSFRYKMLGFVLGAVMASVAGAMYVFFVGFVDPGIMSVDQMLVFVAMVLFGGTRSVAGPVVGAVVLTALPHMIQLNAELRSIVYGCILIAVILLMPKGVTGALSQLAGRLRHA